MPMRIPARKEDTVGERNVTTTAIVVQNYDGKGYDHEIGENEIARETAEIISH